MSIYIYPAQPIDRSVLFDLELKCQDYPIQISDWKDILGGSEGGEFSHYSCYVFKRNNTPYGYLVFSEVPVEKENAKDDLYVLRLGVHPQLRRQGIGTALVEYAKHICEKRSLSEFQIMVPEYWMDPEENRGVKEFTEAHNLCYFQTEKDAYHHYGRLYDGLTFRSGGKPVPA